MAKTKYTRTQTSLHPEIIDMLNEQMILVTGGTGMVGSHLLFELTKERARKVRAIYRKEPSLESVKRIFTDLSADGEQQFATIEWVKADLDDIPALEAAFRDIVFVFHCAGFISYDPKDFDKLIKINVEGTATIVNLCLSFGVQKLCYVSSVASLSAAVGKVADEQNEWNPEARNSDYAISKHGGEMEVWRGSQEGLKVIIVNPSIILGRSDYNSGSGLLFKQVASESPRYTTGGSGYVDAKDVARAMVALQFSEVANERFVLNAANLTYKEIFEKIAKILGVKAPTKPISHKALRFMARVDGFLSFLRLKKRTLTLVLADAGGEVKQYNGEKITKTIDFQYTDIDKTIEEVGKDYVKSQGLGGIND